MFPSCWFSWGLSFSSMKSCTHFWCCMVFTIVLECSINIRLQFRCQMFFCFVLGWVVPESCSRLTGVPSILSAGASDFSVRDVWHYHWELFRRIRAIVFSHQRVNICNIPNGEKVVQSLPSAAAWWTWLMYSKTRLPQPLRCVLGDSSRLFLPFLPFHCLPSSSLTPQQRHVFPISLSPEVKGDCQL